ncbi:MAG: ISKra4 family transposase [Dehalococcoidia bacterium]
MSRQHLPPAMVAASNALAWALSEYADAHPDTALATLEAEVLAAVRTALPALLHAVLQGTLRSLAAQPVRCPRCQHRASVHDWRPRQLLTTCGLLRWERPWATCSTCGQGFGTGDATLGIVPYQQQSAGVTALVTALGSTLPFREAAQVLTRTTGLVLGRETVRRDTEGAGTAVADAQDAVVAAAAGGAEPAVVDPAPGVLVAETDGVMVRYQTGWHEVKIAVVGGLVAAPRPAADGAVAVERRLTAPRSVAAREESTAFAQRVGAEVARRGGLAVVGWHGQHQGGAELRPVVVLGEGAQWIWVTVASQFGTVIEIVNLYHACEHLTTVAGLLHGAGTAAATAWAAARRDELRQQGVDVILPQLTAPVGRTAEAMAGLRTEQGYFRGNQARMQYPTFRGQGLPIGSGAVESSAKHVIQQRMKRAGMRWSDPGGRALIALRAQHATEIGVAA